MRLMITIVLAALALAACDPSGSGATTPTTEAPAPVDATANRQSLVNACMDEGENKDACECLASAAMEKAPKAFLSDMIAAAKKFEEVEMTSEMAADPATARFFEASAACALQSNEEIVLQRCLASGTADDSVCACRNNILQRELDPILFGMLATAIKEDPAYAMGSPPDSWDAEWQASFTDAMANAGACVSSRQ